MPETEKTTPNPEEARPIIEVNNLSVTYFMGRSNEVKALQDVSLKIYPGEFIIFFGPSGCGKSTLLYSIAGLETHTHGDILVDGKNVAKMKKNEIAEFRQKKIGMIFQAFYLINSLSIVKNVVLPQIAINAERISRLTKAKKLLEHFGVSTQADKLPSELSGGQQQRVAICRALMNDPQIVLADEPVGNLDSKSSRDVMELIGELNSDQKKTIILVTHDPSHLNLAHRVFYMKDGKVIDVKVNNAINEAVIDGWSLKEAPTVSKELELLIRTYSGIAPGQLGGLLIPFKAKQVVAEVMTGMSAEELNKIEKQVQQMMLSSLEDRERLISFLDRPESEGGVELDKRTALRLGEKIERVLEEIRVLQKEEKEQKEGKIRGVDKQASEARSYLLETFNVDLHDQKQVQAMDKAIAQRLTNKIDKNQLSELLHQPLPAGPDLDRRIARKIAKHFELLMLGKFSG